MGLFLDDAKKLELTSLIATLAAVIVFMPLINHSPVPVQTGAILGR